MYTKEKTGLSTDEIKEMLNNETWFTASEAFEKVLQTLMKRKPKKKKKLQVI